MTINLCCISPVSQNCRPMISPGLRHRRQRTPFSPKGGGCSIWILSKSIKWDMINLRKNFPILDLLWRVKELAAGERIVPVPPSHGNDQLGEADEEQMSSHVNKRTFSGFWKFVVQIIYKEQQLKTSWRGSNAECGGAFGRAPCKRYSRFKRGFCQSNKVLKISYHRALLLPHHKIKPLKTFGC